MQSKYKKRKPIDVRDKKQPDKILAFTKENNRWAEYAMKLISKKIKQPVNKKKTDDRSMIEKNSDNLGNGRKNY